MLVSSSQHITESGHTSLSCICTNTIQYSGSSVTPVHPVVQIHSRKMNLTRGINLRKIAEMMPGASGAEVKGVCTEAGMYALRERRVHVTQEDFEMAVAKVMQKDSEKNMSIKKLWK